MKKKLALLVLLPLSATLMHCSSPETDAEETVETDIPESVISELKKTIEFKGSKVSYFGTNEISEDDLLAEARLIDIADRRFESKWVNKDPKGISEEYTPENAVFMKPGTKPRLGRSEIEDEFSKSVQGTDKVSFFQDELQFYGEMDVAFQRCHMLGFVDEEETHVFEGSYVILWKKVDGEWLIEYDMFNSDK